MNPTALKRLFSRFRFSKRALAIPLTFLILFVSTLGLIAVTYYFAVERVNAQSHALSATTAKQDFLTLDEDVMSVVWQPGSARTFTLADSGGQLKIEPSANLLTLNVTDNFAIAGTVYNASVGQVAYELPFSGSPETGLYLKGDSRTVTNQSGSVMTQLSIESGDQYPEIHLRYRPTVTYTSTVIDGVAVNTVRIYVVNLNGSDVLALYGKLPLRISSSTTHVTATTYSVSSGSSQLFVGCLFDGVYGEVTLPLAYAVGGAVVNVDVVECNVLVSRCLM